MKQFNLKDALNGAPVCTRDGEPVTQLVKFHVDGTVMFAGVVGRFLYKWYKCGTSVCPCSSHLDLFMAPVKKTGWVARYASNTVGGVIWGSEKVAVTECPHAVSYHKIEWEE